MPFFIYILYSASHDRHYIGQTQDMEIRLSRHNSGMEKATAPYRPWVVKCVLEKPSRGEAMKLEQKLKNLNRIKLLAFIERYG